MSEELKNTITGTDPISLEYYSIVKPDDSTVVVTTEWNKSGDFFQKLSTYDPSYMPVKTLGGTTLLPK